MIQYLSKMSNKESNEIFIDYIIMDIYRYITWVETFGNNFLNESSVKWTVKYIYLRFIVLRLQTFALFNYIEVFIQ